MGGTDLISRQDAIEAIEQMQMPIMRSEFPEEQFVFTGMSEALQAIKDLPSAPIEERKTGKWIERNPQNSDKCRLIECDQCGFAHIVGFNVPYEHWIENRNFCERCGADMRKKGEK